MPIFKCYVLVLSFLIFKNSKITMKKKTIVKISIALLLILFAMINKYTFLISAFIFGIAFFFADDDYDNYEGV